jgi:hypothetical protein
MSIVERTPMEPMVGDPDDHRPDTSWGLLVDPGMGEAPRRSRYDLRRGDFEAIE